MKKVAKFDFFDFSFFGKIIFYRNQQPTRCNVAVRWKI